MRETQASRAADTRTTRIETHAPLRGHPPHVRRGVAEAVASAPYAESAGVPQEQLYYYMENLWLDGLVQKAEGRRRPAPA